MGGGPWPAWPGRGIRFDWIGAGDLYIKLRLPCDPVFHRGIHTAVRGRACQGSPLTPLPHTHTHTYTA